VWVVPTITDEPIKGAFFQVQSHELPRTLIGESPLIGNLGKSVVNNFHGGFQVLVIPFVIVGATKEEAR
jgi:hypothetical protein